MLLSPPLLVEPDKYHKVVFAAPTSEKGDDRFWRQAAVSEARMDDRNGSVSGPHLTPTCGSFLLGYTDRLPRWQDERASALKGLAFSSKGSMSVWASRGGSRAQ